MLKLTIIDGYVNEMTGGLEVYQALHKVLNFPNVEEIYRLKRESGLAFLKLVDCKVEKGGANSSQIIISHKDGIRIEIVLSFLNRTKMQVKLKRDPRQEPSKLFGYLLHEMYRDGVNEVRISMRAPDLESITKDELLSHNPYRIMDAADLEVFQLT